MHIPVAVVLRIFVLYYISTGWLHDDCLLCYMRTTLCCQRGLLYDINTCSIQILSFPIVIKCFVNYSQYFVQHNSIYLVICRFCCCWCCVLLYTNSRVWPTPRSSDTEWLYFSAAFLDLKSGFKPKLRLALVFTKSTVGHVCCYSSVITEKENICHFIVIHCNSTFIATC